MARKCSYCNHMECDRCRAEQKKGKKGYCCQCHRTNVMNGGGSSSGSGSSGGRRRRKFFRSSKKK